MAIKLTGDAVTAILKDCLYRGEELNPPESGLGAVPDGAALAEGLTRSFAFHPERLASHKAEIGQLLAQLPSAFQPASQGGGGGWSFLNACMNKDGQQWTGFHVDIEALFCLGVATGQAEWMMKDMASVLPGGVPYVAMKAAA